jgi:hypothetical protein
LAKGRLAASSKNPSKVFRDLSLARYRDFWVGQTLGAVAPSRALRG